MHISNSPSLGQNLFLPLVAPGDIPIPPGFQQIEKDSVLIRPLTDDDSTEASTLSSAEPLVEGSPKSVIR